MFCAYNRTRYQVSAYRTIGPLVDRIFFILADKEDNHNISDEFEIRSDSTTDWGVSCP